MMIIIIITIIIVIIIIITIIIITIIIIIIITIIINIFILCPRHNFKSGKRNSWFGIRVAKIKRHLVRVENLFR